MSVIFHYIVCKQRSLEEGELLKHVVTVKQLQQAAGKILSNRQGNEGGKC